MTTHEKIEQLRIIAGTLDIASRRVRSGRPCVVDHSVIEQHVDNLIDRLSERDADLLCDLSGQASDLYAMAQVLEQGQSMSPLRLIGGLLSFKSGIALFGQIQERKEQRAA